MLEKIRAFLVVSQFLDNLMDMADCQIEKNGYSRLELLSPPPPFVHFL